jgi:hypothetical protein
MKHMTLMLISMMGLITVSTVVVLAGDSSPVGTENHSADKKPAPGNVQWYEKAAEKVGPAGGAAAKDGDLLTLQMGSMAYMEGNSTLHKYQMNAQSLRGSALLKTSSKNLVKDIQDGRVGPMSFAVPIDTFKSKDSGLDKNAYQALKASDDPEIKFLLTSETLKPGMDAGTFIMTAKGSLTVAGQTAPITLTADTTVKGDQIRLKGIQQLKFTEFKIKPPSASILFVTITCADEFEVHYDVTFAPSKSEGKVAGIPGSRGS